MKQNNPFKEETHFESREPSMESMSSDGANEASGDDRMSRRGIPKSLQQQASYLFKFLFLANITLYIEAGALPALLHSLKSMFDMTYAQQGMLGKYSHCFLLLSLFSV